MMSVAKLISVVHDYITVLLVFNAQGPLHFLKGGHLLQYIITLGIINFIAYNNSE